MAVCVESFVAWLLAAGCGFPPGPPVSSTRKLMSSSSFHRLDITLAVAEALNPNKPNQTKPEINVDGASIAISLAILAILNIHSLRLMY